MPRLKTYSATLLNNTALPTVTKVPSGTLSLAAGSTLSPTGTAGSTNGVGSAARFNFPVQAAVAPNGLDLYVCDLLSHRVRKIVLSTMTVSTLAGTGVAGDVDGTALAQLSSPRGIVISPDGLYAYITDKGNFRIKRITLADGTVTTIAGTGATGYTDASGTSAAFGNLGDITINAAGTILYIADVGNHRIRKLVISGAVVTTIAGSGAAAVTDGIGTAAAFNAPQGIAINPLNTFLYVADFSGHTIRSINLSTNEVKTIAGTGSAGSTDGIGQGASFNAPAGLGMDITGRILYVASRSGHKVRKLNLSTGRVTTLVGSGVAGFAAGDGSAAQVNGPEGVAVHPNGRELYVTEFAGNRVDKVV